MSFQSDHPMDVLERFLRKYINSVGRIAGLISIPIIFLLGFSCFYTVQPDEEAVVLRFGKYLKTTSPGLHLKMPMGVDRAIKVKTKLILQQEFGFRTSGSSVNRTNYSNKNYKDESLMLTGDLNVADVEWITQFQISEPQKYLFNVRNPIQNIRDISEAIMRRVVGDRLVNDVLTIGRTEIAAQAKELTQKILNEYDMGVNVVSIKLQDVNPPELVKPSFNEVNEAKQEQEQAINQAEKYYNQIIPEARGKAEKTIAEAEGYAEATLNTAKGDAKRFSSLLKSYQKAPQITRDRMYIETLEKVMKKLDRITVVDPKIQGLLPVFGGIKSEK